MDRPRAVPILGIQRETARHFTLTFRDPLLAASHPGQFAMLWIPGVDEVPMALGESPAPGTCSIVVDEIGNGTKALGKMTPGELIGVRGPYGNRFPAAEGRTLLVGGGIGVPPLVLVAQEAKQAKRKATGALAHEGHGQAAASNASRRATVEFVIGARSGDLLAGLASVERWSDKVHVCTDDGSRGAKGYTTDVAAKLMQSQPFDVVMTCGPEVMMEKVVDLATKHKVPVYASIERYMKCGIGICDQCTLGPGIRLCREGPILSGEQLKICPEFGQEMRAPDGSRVPMHAGGGHGLLRA